MKMISVKAALNDIAEQLPQEASYLDAMYQLYVRMKIAAGREAAEQGHLVSHEEVKQRFFK